MLTNDAMKVMGRTSLADDSCERTGVNTACHKEAFASTHETSSTLSSINPRPVLGPNRRHQQEHRPTISELSANNKLKERLSLSPKENHLTSQALA